MDESWIKLYRKLTEWGWYSDVSTKVLFIHLLLKATYREIEYCGVKLYPGEYVSGIPALAAETGLSVRNVRTAIKHLEVTGEVTRRKYPKFTVYKVEKWSGYQADDSLSDSQVTVKRQPSDSLVTTKQEYKKLRNKEVKNKASMQADSIPVLADVQEYAAESGGLYDPLDFYKRMENDDWTYNGKPVRNWKKLYDGFSRNAKVKREKEKDISRTWLDALKEI